MKPNTILAWSGIFASALSAPGATLTSTLFITVISTVTISPASTVYTFLPGNPPSSTPSPTAGAANNERAEEHRSHPTVTSTVTETITIEALATTTLYPCANPFPTLTPTLPYGDATLPSDFSTENTLYYVSSTPEGASAQACCNACFFELENCVQAYWYSYEGCVVSQATNSSVAGSASGEQKSPSCPAGIFRGLTYEQDTNPAFRSTGNIAGPCGETYNNL